MTPPKKKILVVEDCPEILELISFNLEKEGYEVRRAESGEEGLSLVKKDIPDIVLLDLMLPGIDGLEVCRRLKAEDRTRAVPVVIVSAKGEESDVVSGLELGAYDYVSKPFRPKELLARVRAVLRRVSTPEPSSREVIRLHGMELNPMRRELRLAGKPVELTFTEFELLHFLMRRPGWVFTRYQIVDAVRGGDYPVTDRSVDVQIVGLRKKLGNSADYIETVRGVGYRFGDDPS